MPWSHLWGRRRLPGARTILAVLMARRTRWARRRSGPPRSGGGRSGGPGGIRTGGGNGGRGGGGNARGEGVGAQEPEYSRAQLIVALLIFPIALLLIPTLILLIGIAFNIGGDPGFPGQP